MLNRDIQNDISELTQYKDKWKSKWLRNFRLYCYSMNVSLDQIKEGNVIGYWNLINSDYTSGINENIIQSCIDALVSQLAAKHARPFFSTVNGTFFQMQVAKQTQQYFDMMFDEQDVNRTITEAFRDACIFGSGFVYIDSHTHKIQKALPWQIMFRPAEDTYGKITRVLYERKQYPTSLLKDYKGKEQYVTKRDYWDVNKHIHVSLINDKEEYTEVYDAPTIPFVRLNYINPVYGKDTTSVVDILYGIQMKLDELYTTIGEAIRLNPSSVYFVPQGSGVKATSLTNRVGQIFTYKPIEGLTNPITPFQPSFIAEQYMASVEQFKKDAYELVGISQLSAQSKKPAGLDSGIALKTMNDIESERFEVQYKAVIRAYCEVAKLCILTFDEEENVLPEDNNRLNIKWSDVVENYSKMKIQFSSMDYLSKDPSTKIQQINALVANGIIPQSRASQYFDMPDIDSAYNFASNSLNAVYAVINNALTNNDFTVPEYVPFDLLKQEIINTMLSLKAVENEQNVKDIESLKVLYNEVSKIIENMNNQATMQNEQTFNDALNKDALQIENNAKAQIVGEAEGQVLASNIMNGITNNIGVM